MLPVELVAVGHVDVVTRAAFAAAIARHTSGLDLARDLLPVPGSAGFEHRLHTDEPHRQATHEHKEGAEYPQAEDAAFGIGWRFMPLGSGLFTGRFRADDEVHPAQPHEQKHDGKQEEPCVTEAAVFEHGFARLLRIDEALYLRARRLVAQPVKGGGAASVHRHAAG